MGTGMFFNYKARFFFLLKPTVRNEPGDLIGILLDWVKTKAWQEYFHRKTEEKVLDHEV